MARSQRPGCSEGWLSPELGPSNNILNMLSYKEEGTETGKLLERVRQVAGEGVYVGKTYCRLKDYGRNQGEKREEARSPAGKAGTRSIGVLGLAEQGVHVPTSGSR